MDSTPADATSEILENEKVNLDGDLIGAADTMCSSVNRLALEHLSRISHLNQPDVSIWTHRTHAPATHTPDTQTVEGDDVEKLEDNNEPPIREK